MAVMLVVTFAGVLMGCSTCNDEPGMR